MKIYLFFILSSLLFILIGGQGYYLSQRVSQLEENYNQLQKDHNRLKEGVGGILLTILQEINKIEDGKLLPPSQEGTLKG